MDRRNFVVFTTLAVLQGCASAGPALRTARDVPSRSRQSNTGYANYALLVATQSRADLDINAAVYASIDRLAHALGPSSFAGIAADQRARRFDPRAGLDIVTSINRAQGAALSIGARPMLIVTSRRPDEALHGGEVACAFEFEANTGEELASLIDLLANEIMLRGGRTQPKSCEIWQGVAAGVPSGSIIAHFIPPTQCRPQQ